MNMQTKIYRLRLFQSNLLVVVRADINYDAKIII